MTPAPTLPLSCIPPGAKCLTVLTLDAGQGDCTLIVLPDKSLILVDCGSKKNGDVVSPEIGKVFDAYLPAAGNRLKALVLTHPDGDHYNLLMKLLVDRQPTIETVIYGGQRKDYVSNNVGVWLTHRAASGERIRGLDDATVPKIGQKYWSAAPDPDLTYRDAGNNIWDVEVRILAANVGDGRIKAEANPNSVVLLLTYSDINMFLMGDSTEQTEDFILNCDRATGFLTTLLNGRRTMLRLGHHGSKTSSGPAWLGKIEPEAVLVSSDTRTFGRAGSSIPASAVMDHVRALPKMADNVETAHHFVQYNEVKAEHEAVTTTKRIYSTLNLLNFKPPPNQLEFTADGTSWWYTVSRSTSERKVFVTPACGWDDVNKPIP
jgi:beta-lactamase superfamily II metal-dependent hydrolase